MFRILNDTHFDFVRRWRIAFGAVAIAIIPALIMILVSNFRYSIEFTGGTLAQVKFESAVDVGAVRQALTDGGVAGAEISTFGSADEVVIRAQAPEMVENQASGAEIVGRQIQAALQSRFGTAFRVIRTEAVGPRVGSELRRQAVIAMLIAFAATLIYLAWRFEWRFAAASVLATVHDIIATFAFMKYLDLEISLFVVGGVLTVVGYSMNDKVVVFDRVRENLRKHQKEGLRDLLNRSVNETLPRTVMTGSTTLACLLALLIFGGEVIRPFAWVLTFGILIGTFSSIFVASPILLWIEARYARDPGGKGSRASATTPAPAKAR